VSDLPVTRDDGVADGTTARGSVVWWQLWPVLVVLACVYLPFVGLRIATHDVFWFVHMGRQTLEAASTSTIITPARGWQSEAGYDGQYYYALAVDPRHAKDYMPLDDRGFVYSRPLYPALARTLALGSTAAVPYTMLLLNLLAVAAGTLAVAIWLRRRGLPPLYALLYGLFPGLVFCVFRDLTEPVAYGLAALAALVLDSGSRRALVGSAALFALAGLTRETTLVFAAAAALAIGLSGKQRARPAMGWLTAALFLAGCTIPLFAWRSIAGRFVDAPTQERGDGLESLIPFHGIAHYWPWHDQHVLIVGAVILPTLISLIGLPMLLRRRATIPVGALLALNAAPLVVFLPSGVDVDYGAAGRAAIGVVLATLACLPRWTRDGRLSPHAGAVVLTWSFPWFLAVATLVGIPGWTLTTT